MSSDEQYKVFDVEPWVGMSPMQKRDIRDRAVGHAAYLHSADDAVNIVFNREETVRELLVTAEVIYQWIIQEDQS